MSTLTKIQVAWNLYQEEIPVDQIAIRCEVHRATIYRWIRRFRTCGLRRTLQLHKQAKTRRRKRLDPIIQKRIYALRVYHRQCCGQKIQRYLEREYGHQVSLATIYRVLAKKYRLSSKYRAKRAYGKVPKGTKPREVIQADTVDFGEIYAYTFVDTYTREAQVVLRPTLRSVDGKRALQIAMRSYKRTEILQSDGGPEFKEEFVQEAGRYAKRHRVSRPYKKNEQAFIESFNRSLRKECLGWMKYSNEDMEKLQGTVNEWLRYYHEERLHIGLGYMTPQEHLQNLSHLT